MVPMLDHTIMVIAAVMSLHVRSHFSYHIGKFMLIRVIRTSSGTFNKFRDPAVHFKKLGTYIIIPWDIFKNR